MVNFGNKFKQKKAFIDESKEGIVTRHPSGMCTKKAGYLFDCVQNYFSQSKNYPYLVDFMTGTTMVALAIRSMKLTSKDILLLLGILVAVIITLTTIVYSERTSPTSATQNDVRPSEKTSLNSSTIVKKVISLIDSKSRVSY